VSDHSTTLRLWIDRHNAGDSAACEELLRFSEDRFRLLAHARLRQFARLRRFVDTGDVLVGAQLRFAAAIRTLQFRTLDDFLRLGAAMMNRQLIDLSRHYFGPLGAGRHEVGATADAAGGATRPEPADPGVTPAAATQQTDIDEVIAGLSPVHRELFDLMYYQGLSVAEAADFLAVSTSTVKRRWLEARTTFMERYSDGPANPLES
jgi:RNA polymerase sigma factor (sigma-70 family)